MIRTRRVKVRTYVFLLFFLFVFPFFIFFFSSFFSSAFRRSPCPIPCSFFVRFCPFVLSFSVWFLYRLLRFYFRFPAFLGGGFCYSVISSGRYTSPGLLASLKYVYSPCVQSSCVADVDLSLFSSSLPSLFRFRFGHRLFSSCLFLVGTCCLLGFGFCCDSFSILVWCICILIRTYAYLPFFFSSEVSDFFHVFLCYYLLFLYICFFLRQFSAPELLEPVLWPRTAL